MSLSKPTEKMSKCETDEHSRIDLLDPPEVVFSKIRDSVTDSVRGRDYILMFFHCLY